jgi:hypothetical protein
VLKVDYLQRKCPKINLIKIINEHYGRLAPRSATNEVVDEAMDEGLGERISTAVSDNIEAIRLSDENSGEGD